MICTSEIGEIGIYLLNELIHWHHDISITFENPYNEADHSLAVFCGLPILKALLRKNFPNDLLRVSELGVLINFIKFFNLALIVERLLLLFWLRATLEFALDQLHETLHVISSSINDN